MLQVIQSVAEPNLDLRARKRQCPPPPPQYNPFFSKKADSEGSPTMQSRLVNRRVHGHQVAPIHRVSPLVLDKEHKNVDQKETRV